MSKWPLVSIVIPMRNEERHIGACLDAILTNTYPDKRLEIIVVDGQSEDCSREVVQTRMQYHPQIRLLDNPRKITAAAMNVGISTCQGDYIFMINAHARISPEFVKRSIQTLHEHPEADAVGGVLVSVNEEYPGRAIALALNAPLGAGGRRYRTRRTPGPIFDTIPYPAYRRSVFDKIGSIDEELIRNQDAEFNYRLLQNGGQLYFNPDIVSHLYSRSSLRQLVSQQFQTGYWKVRLFQKRFLHTNWRHVIPAAFVCFLAVNGIVAVFSKWGGRFLIANLALYALTVVVSSLRVGLRSEVRSLLWLPWIFGTLHVSYGVGTLAGVWDFVVRRRNGEGSDLQIMGDQ